MSHLVWIRSINGRAEAQKWSSLYYGVNDWKKKIVLATHPLTMAEMCMTIDQLKKRYPAPEWREEE